MAVRCLNLLWHGGSYYKIAEFKNS